MSRTVVPFRSPLGLFLFFVGMVAYMLSGDPEWTVVNTITAVVLFPFVVAGSVMLECVVRVWWLNR